MSYLIAQKNLLSEDLKQLISQITGLTETSDEFNAFENNAWSTIIHYKCPSIDKSNIKAQLYGYIEKFKIHAHSFPQKAKNLEMLIEHYLEINYYEEDVTWGILHLLLLLSKRPTEAKEDDTPLVFPLCQTYKDEETFDWGAYLKEGLPDYRLPSSDESSLDEEVTGVKKSNVGSIIKVRKENKRHKQHGNSFGNISAITVDPSHYTGHSHSTFEGTLVASRHPSEIRCNEETCTETVRENRPTLTKEELKAALIAKDACRRSNPTWWTDPLHREKPPSKMPIPNACFTWEQNMSLRGVTIGDTRVLSEAKAMKELISVVNFPRDCYIIRKCEGGYKPREQVSISSTNPVDFYHAISEICPYLSMVECINNFIKIIYTSPVGVNTCSIVPCTFVAYAYALKDIMTSLRNFLNIVEGYIIKQEYIYMISYLMTEVRPWLKHLKFLYTLHMKAIAHDWKHQENWVCAVRLLAVLYNSLECTNGWEKLDLTIIFLKSIQPYINILETWLVHSKYMDHQDEFIIIRSSSHICEGNIIVRDYQSLLSNLNIAKSGFIDNFVYYSIRACSSVDFQIVLQKNSFEDEEVSGKGNDTPFFLEFLSSLINEVQEEGVLFKKSLIPHLKLMKVKYESLKTQNGSNNERTPRNGVNDKNLQVYRPYSWNGFDFVVSDSTLMSAISSFVQPINLNDTYNQSVHYKISVLLKKLEHIDVDSTEVARLLKENFTTIITERMQPKGFARDTLLNEFRLLEHINILKCVYLFLNGVTMSIFSKSLFRKVFSSGLKTISWTNELRELLYHEYPAYYANFIVQLPYKKLNFNKVFNSSENSYPDFIGFSEHININYLLQPPLNLVITSESIEKYNELFQLLLQTKWALLCISNLSFKDLSNREETTLNARLISLRLFLLHNVSTFEKYFISVNSEDFDGEIIQVCSVARDIHVIANAHDKILDQRRIQCFLVRAPEVLERIISILRSCQIFSSLWKMSLQESYYIKTISELSNFEVKYQDCINELANGLLQIGKYHVFKNNVNFSYLCDELFNNMPGDW